MNVSPTLVGKWTHWQQWQWPQARVCAAHTPRCNSTGKLWQKLRQRSPIAIAKREWASTPSCTQQQRSHSSNKYVCTTESSCIADTAQLGTGHRKSSTWGSRIHLPHRRDLQSWSFIYSLRLWRHLWRTASSGIKATSTLLTRPWRRRPASGRLSWWGWGRDTSGRAEGSARRPRTARRACRTAGLRRAPQRWLLQRHPPDPARHPSLALPQPRASPLSSSMRAELASSSCSPYPASARNDFPPAAIANPATAQRARAAVLPPHRPSGACALTRARQQPRRPPFPATGRGWAPAGAPPLLRRPIRAERGRCGAHRSSNEGAEMRLAGRSVAGVWCATPVRGLLAMLCRALLLRAAGHREYREYCEYCAPGAAVQGARTAVGSGVCGPLALRLPDRGVRCSPGPLVSFQVSPHRFPCSISWMAIGAVGKMITCPTEKSECPSRPLAAAFLRVRPHAWDPAERGSRCKLVSAECFKICWRGSALVWAGNGMCTSTSYMVGLGDLQGGPLVCHGVPGCAMRLLQNCRLSQIAKDP